MISEKLRTEFPGIYVLLSALKRAWIACSIYNKALNSVIATELINEWAQTVSERSPLSYEEALYIYTYITEETDLYMRSESGITEFIIDRARLGYRYYAIVGYLAGIDKELDKGVRDKLRMRQ